jgi:putative transposase
MGGGHHLHPNAPGLRLSGGRGRLVQPQGTQLAAIHRYGTPEIFNTDQGSQFTSTDFTTLLRDNGIKISMDGKGCWRDNVFVERLWRSVKYEEVYLYAYDSVSQAKAGLAKYFTLYNTRRPHSSFNGIPPDQTYFGNLPEIRTAA